MFRCRGGEYNELHCKLRRPVQIEPSLRSEVSGKWELFNEWPETFGVFGPRARELGVWRPTTELRKPAIGGLFCD